MTKTLRRSLCLLLLCALFVTLVPAPRAAAAAASGTCGKDGDNLTWTLSSDGTLTISGTGAMKDYGTRDQAPWLSAGAIKRAVLSEGVTSIGRYAFYNGKLEELSLPQSLQSIEPGAFYRCGALKRILLPEGTVSVGLAAFAVCLDLEEIDVSPDNPVFASIDGVLFSKTERSLLCYPSGRQQRSYTIPEGIRSIGDYAFFFSLKLSEITLPESLCSIGLEAFSYTSVKSLAIPAGVTEIGNVAFNNASSLSEITVSPENESFVSPDGVLYTKDGTTLLCYPQGKAGSSYTVPDGTCRLGDSAFRSCRLEEIHLPDSITEIGKGAFAFSTSLTSLTLPANLSAIPDELFNTCTMLPGVEIPASVTEIGKEAFADCEKLKSLTIPASVTAIGADAFSGCDALTLTLTQDSYAAQYCKENGLKYEYPDALDWLNG